jgi:hypothetical protein
MSATSAPGRSRRSLMRCICSPTSYMSRASRSFRAAIRSATIDSLRGERVRLAWAFAWNSRPVSDLPRGTRWPGGVKPYRFL